MKKIVNVLVLLAFMSLPSFIFGAKIDKAYDALKKYDYYGAKELFKKLQKKEPAASCYGQSLIFGRDNNPFYNLDSAYTYIIKADTNYRKLNFDEKSELKRFSLDSLSIEKWKDRIDSLSYLRAQKDSSIESYNKFINQNYDAIQIPQAINVRNKLAFEKAKNINSARSYSEFIKEYPKADQIYEAKNRYEERLFIEYTESDKVLEYLNFIKNYPQSPFLESAEDSVFYKTTDIRDINSLNNFIKSFPNNHNINQAWRKVYNLYLMEYSPQKIIDFRIEYPNYPFLNELVEDIKLAQKQLFKFKKEGFYGFIDKEGNTIISPIYEAVGEFSEGLAVVIKENKLGYINKQNEVVVPFEYEDGESFINGFAIVSKNNNYGLINRNNQSVVPLDYEYVGNFYSGLAVVSNDTAYGYVNRDGEEVIPLNLDYGSDFKDNYAIVEIEGGKGMINSLGTIVIAPKYSWIEPFNKYGLARAKNDSAYGILDKNGAEVLPFIYDRVGEFSNGLAIIAKDNKYGYANILGEIVIQLNYDFTDQVMVWGNIKRGYTKFHKKDKYGILDSTGVEIFPPIFEDVGDYSESQLIAVKKRGKWGYSNSNLRLIIPYKYELAQTFNEDFALVKMEEGYNFITNEGNLVMDVFFEDVLEEDTFYIVKSEGFYGLIAQNLETLLAIEFSNIKRYDRNYLQVSKNQDINYWSIKEKRLIIQD